MMWDDGPGAVTVSSYIHGWDETAITAEQLAQAKTEWTRVLQGQPDDVARRARPHRRLRRPATSGRATPGRARTRPCSRDVPMAYADPKEGRNSWVGVYGIRKGSPNYDLALRFLDEKLGDATGENLVNTWYYGTANADVMAGITDETLKEAFSVDDPSILENTNFTPNLTAEQRDAWIAMWSEAKACGSREPRSARPPASNRRGNSSGPPAARSAAATRAAAPSSGCRCRRRSRWSLFLVAPLVLMVALSFRPELTSDLLGAVRADPRALPAGGRGRRATGSCSQTSALMAFVVAIVATALAYPIAYFLAFRAGRRAGLFLILLLVPFWTSYLLRVMAWKLMLGNAGVINSALVGTGIIEEPLTPSCTAGTTVIVTLIYVWIPFATLPILAVLGRIDVRCTTPRPTCTLAVPAVPARDPAAEHARTRRGVPDGVHPDDRRVRDAAPRRRHRRDHVRQRHPGLLHEVGELAARLGALGDHARRDARPCASSALRVVKPRRLLGQ